MSTNKFTEEKLKNVIINLLEYECCESTNGGSFVT